jgi:mannosyl-oligosaccharide glucosidase
MPSQKTSGNDGGDSSQDGGSRASWFMYTFLGVVLATTISAAILYSTRSYSLNTRLQLPLVVSEDVRSSAGYLDRLWGTYRSGVYFGIRPRIPDSVMFGLMWVSPKKREFVIRHNCDQNDPSIVYGWKRHDGKEFGEQDIIDKDVKLKSYFMKTANNSWTARVSVSQANAKVPSNKSVTVMFYAHAEGSNVLQYVRDADGGVSEITGNANKLGPFRLSIPHLKTKGKASKYYLATHLPGGIAHLSDKMKRILQFDVVSGSLYLPGEVDFFPQEGKKDINFVAIQITVKPPLIFDVVYSSLLGPKAAPVYGEAFGSLVEAKKKEFDQRFEKVFQLGKKGFTPEKVEFAKSVFSNLIGGISYFHGRSIVTSKDLSSPLLYWPADLYTAVPSRSFFPRGFLWDEGFHQLVISKWDMSISKVCTSV